jgi:hypothetical protein
VETADITAIPLLRGYRPIAHAFGDNGHHFVAASGNARLRLCLREGKACCPDCLIILHDPHTAARLAAASRFERVTRGGSLGPDRDASPSSYRRIKLTQLLNLQDALDAGASQRELAFGLVFPRLPPFSGATWKGSSERRHTLRLIAEARRLVNGGYLRLLKHR